MSANARRQGRHAAALTGSGRLVFVLIGIGVRDISTRSCIMVEASVNLLTRLAMFSVVTEEVSSIAAETRRMLSRIAVSGGKDMLDRL